MLTAEWSMEKEIAYVRKEAWEEGREEGLERGLQEGRGKRNFEIAQSALAEGATIEFVEKITGLDFNVIKSLQTRDREAVSG